MYPSPQRVLSAQRVTHRYLRAAIVMPPRKLRPYLKRLAGQLDTLDNRLEKEELQAIAEGTMLVRGDSRAADLKGAIEYVLGEYRPDTLGKSILVSLRDTFGALARGLGSEFVGLVDYFNELAKEYENPKVYRELSGLWETRLRSAASEAEAKGLRSDSVVELIRKGRRILQRGTQEVRSHGNIGSIRHSLNNPDNDLGVLLSQKGVPSGTREVVEELKRIVDMAYARLEARREENAYGEPKHEKTETLYHASINAKSLYQTGFSQEMPEEGSGLGGGQETKGKKRGISFTYDLYIAKEIARSFKEAILIANGKIKAKDILDWAKRGSLLEDTLRNLRMHGVSVDPRTLQTPSEVMHLYKAWMIANAMSGKRYNPKFVGDMRKLMRNLKGKRTSDVGVLAASVDMANPYMLFRAEEREFRVLPEAVKSIDRLIR